MDEARKFGWCKSSPRLRARCDLRLGSKRRNPTGEDDMSNLKKLISTTSYDIWIAWTYAIISLLAIVAVYGLSTHGDPSASETIASLYSQQP
jgi:hypothetical protein